MKYKGCHVTYIFLVDGHMYKTQFSSPRLKGNNAWSCQLFLINNILTSDVCCIFPTKAFAARLLRAELRKEVAL